MQTKAKKQAQRRSEAKRQEDLKRKAKEQAEQKVEAGRCLYCGNLTLCRDYVVNPGASHELPCCGEDCFEKANAFVEYDKHKRMVFYLILLVFVIANLFLLGFHIETKWQFVPLFGMGITTAVYPLIFTRYERYQRFGIKRTKRIIRTIAATISAFALLLLFTC